MSDSDNNSGHSDSENSQSSHQSVETTVSTEEQNRRLKEQVAALTAILGVVARRVRWMRLRRPFAGGDFCRDGHLG